MPRRDDNALGLLQLPFDDLPDANKAHAYGVDYARLILDDGGELYLTRLGWAISMLSTTRDWFVSQQHHVVGQRLTGTGTVYRVPIVVPVGATEDVVVKFSRVAQDVPLFVDKPVADIVPRADIENATFNDPFEEFGLLSALRRGPFGLERPRIMTKRPLAIYSPPRNYELWQLGRKEWLFAQHVGRLKADQEENGAGAPVSLHLTRDYILFFQWVKGLDAQQLYIEGVLTKDDLRALYDRSSRELRANGFLVLDHKPEHLVLRPCQYKGQAVPPMDKVRYALIDFELLKRTSPGSS